MSICAIGFIKLHEKAQLPVYATNEAACADVHSVENHIIQPGTIKLVKTGLGCVIPQGWEVQVRPRSGLALKHKVTVLNTPGTVDSDYQRGELGVILINHGEAPFEVRVGDRIAQISVKPVHTAAFSFVQESRETERGEGGFGSTGQ